MIKTTTRRTPLSRVSLVTGALLVILALAPAFAQSPQTGPSLTTEVGELIRQGQQLEIERRWSEALTHYEEAVRRFPEERSLKRRFEFTRLHYDLGRRYSDRSYRDVLMRLSLAQTLDIYTEVLLKVQAHYVEIPNWKELIERGTNSLEVALSEPTFLELHAPAVEEQAIDAFRRELRGLLGPLVIESRSDARDAVAAAAALAEDRLDVSPTAVALEYTCGATNSLDAYSTYLTPDQLTEVYSQIEGNFVGLGIELKADDGALAIVRVIGGSPAEKSGILAGDRITTVDGKSTRKFNTDEAANLLQGEAGSVVELTVLTPGLQPRLLRVRREHVEVPSVDDVKMADSARGVAYLRLTCFQKTTCRDLDAALWRLYRSGMKSLIMDLRGNPGGLLVTAVEVADKFIKTGVIVSTRGRSMQEDFTYSAHEGGTWGVPLVVLIDHNSASAAEIFAGAIREHQRGTIVGQRSYGKGSVQGIFPLNLSSSGLRLTTAKFYSPSGRPYSHVGVEPDVKVHEVARPIDASGQLPSPSAEDPMLSAAVQLLLKR